MNILTKLLVLRPFNFILNLLYRISLEIYFFYLKAVTNFLRRDQQTSTKE